MPRSAPVFWSGLRWRLVACVVAVALAFPPAGAGGQARAQSASAYGTEAVHAGFLLKFIGFTDWPAQALPENAPFVIGVSGSRAVEDELLRLADKQLMRDRRIRVVRVNNVRDLAGCHVLYIRAAPRAGEEVSPGAEELLPEVRNRPVLTVSESPSFLAQGGIVNLYLAEGAKLRFEISTENAKASGLVLSSKLLALARIVNPRQAPPSPRP